MQDFPPFPDELAARLRLDAEAFDAFIFEYFGAVPPRHVEPGQAEYGLQYPWARPVDSFVMRDGEVESVDDDTLRAFLADRHPILAVGSNGSPEALQRKFGHFQDARDRDVLVVAGDLHGFDIGPAAGVAVYGAMPATLFASPGTAVRSSVVFATDAQATQLTWSELSYRFGRLDDIRFDVDHSGVDITSVYVYISRFGTFGPDGEPVALAAVPADNRTAPARTQKELMQHAARILLGDDATAADLTEAMFGDLVGTAKKQAERLRRYGIPFVCEHWSAFS